MLCMLKNHKNLRKYKKIGRESLLLNNKLGYYIASQNKLKTINNNPCLTNPNDVV